MEPHPSRPAGRQDGTFPYEALINIDKAANWVRDNHLEPERKVARDERAAKRKAAKEAEVLGPTQNPEDIQQQNDDDEIGTLKHEVITLRSALEIAKQEVREERIKREQAEEELAALRNQSTPTPKAKSRKPTTRLNPPPPETMMLDANVAADLEGDHGQETDLEADARIERESAALWDKHTKNEMTFEDVGNVQRALPGWAEYNARVKARAEAHRVLAAARGANIATALARPSQPIAPDHALEAANLAFFKEHAALKQAALKQAERTIEPPPVVAQPTEVVDPLDQYEVDQYADAPLEPSVSWGGSPNRQLKQRR